MKAVERHLYSRNGHYYYRASISKGLHDLLSFREIKIGLATKDLTLARLQSAHIDYEIAKSLRLLQSDFSKLSPEQSPETIVQKFLSDIREVKSSFGYQPPMPVNANWKKDRGSKQGALSFSQVVQKYFDDCLTDSYSTRFQKEATYTLFIELVGDIAFNSIDMDKARLFKSLLMKIPSNAKKLHNIESFKGVDLDKLKGKPQHPKTINNRLAYLIALFNWAIRTGYYHGNNPFSNLTIRSKSGLSARRHPFREEEIRMLFHSPLYRDSQQDSMRWVPLIGLYSGMRMNEICQLYVEDIRQEEGVYIFDVNDDGKDKGLKTQSSRRKIPIHKELIRKGLLEYASKMSLEGQQRLFPDIHRSKDQSYSSVFSKRFRRLLTVLGIKRQGLCFHSFRHTFIDGMRNTGVEKAIVMAITGHQSSNDVHDDYGYGYNLLRLQEGINKLTFPI